VQDDTRPEITLELAGKAQAARDEVRGAAPDTLDSLIAVYEAAPEYTRLADSTKRDYRLWLTRISQEFGKTPLHLFEDPEVRIDIVEWRNRWSEQPRTADKASVMMATLLGFGVDSGRLSVNRAAGIKQLHHVNKADEVWEDRHWEAMGGVNEKGKPICPAHLMDALKLAHLTGLRLGDLVDLDWEHVGEKAIIFITNKRKGRAVIPILPELRRHLESREHREGIVLRNSRGQPWTESGLGSVFQKNKPEGFDRTIHDLRGTFATWLAVKGLTDEQIARIIGWTAKRVGEVRARYVDEARVILSLVDRLSA
jgi:integrase